jgi:hypothetical protein
MLEYLYGKRFGYKIVWANRKDGDRVVAGPSTETTHMEATGGYVKEIGRVSGWAKGR